jgi:rod shape determining protein RodA
VRRSAKFEYRSRRSRSRGWRLLLPEIAWGRFDWLIFLLAVVLLASGLVFVHSAFDANLSFHRSELTAGKPFVKHVKTVVISIPVLLAGLYLRPTWLRRHALSLYVVGLGLLALVPFIGIELNNARRWLETPVGFNLQPSEPMKILLILALARILYRNRLESLGDWVRPALIALVPMAMVAAQPDLGTSLTIPPVTLGMLYLAGARGRTIVGLVLAGALVGFLAWSGGVVKDYQLRRIDTWVSTLEPAELIEERNAAAFHAYNARVAVGNGGLRGTGLGGGIANRAGHLPEKESDSIWAVIAEELGLFGSGALLFAYSLFAMLIVRAAGELRDRYSRLVVGGIGIYFAVHAFVHVGVNIGLLPMTGLTLPLFSTGGSSILASFGALGLALGLTARRSMALDEDAFR